MDEKNACTNKEGMNKMPVLIRNGWTNACNNKEWMK